jgi:hypothetical protein
MITFVQVWIYNLSKNNQASFSLKYNNENDAFYNIQYVILDRLFYLFSFLIDKNKFKKL